MVKNIAHIDTLTFMVCIKNCCAFQISCKFSGETVYFLGKENKAYEKRYISIRLQGNIIHTTSQKSL